MIGVALCSVLGFPLIAHDGHVEVSFSFASLRV